MYCGGTKWFGLHQGVWGADGSVLIRVFGGGRLVQSSSGCLGGADWFSLHQGVWGGGADWFSLHQGVWGLMVGSSSGCMGG